MLLRIGALSKLSGIPSPTLRAWELRYGAFKPVKTPSGQRLYARSEASRAVLIRLLADQGFSLQQLASAGLNELLSLKDSSRQADGSTAKHSPKLKKQPTAPSHDDSREALKVLILGESLPLRLLQSSIQAKLQSLGLSLEVVKQAPKAKHYADDRLGLVMLEMVSMLEQDCQAAIHIKAKLGPKPLMLLYRFGAAHFVSLLRNAGIAVYREPIEDERLVDAMSALCRSDRSNEDVTATRPRRYSMARIRQIAQSMPSTSCECPRHVSEILEQLLAFEDYSQQCLSNGAKDLALHAELLRVAANTRAQFEDALEAVARHEGFKL
ncbi:MAG: MerR family transcriptional regulator [Burkholderiaceae bacterium]